MSFHCNLGTGTVKEGLKCPNGHTKVYPMFVYRKGEKLFDSYICNECGIDYYDDNGVSKPVFSTDQVEKLKKGGY